MTSSLVDQLSPGLLWAQVAPVLRLEPANTEGIGQEFLRARSLQVSCLS